MPASLTSHFAQQLASGLKRKAVTSCSRWAEMYRVMGQPFPGPFSFKHHPWLKAMHDSDAEFNVGQKSAQMGYTETALNLALYSIDIRGLNVLYVLPTRHPDATNFSADRFGGALELSPHLCNMFSEVSNVGHKKTGLASLYIRGSRSRSQLKSIPAAVIILDEKDEMTPKNVPLAYARTDGQTTKLIWELSTPTAPGFGINVDFEHSTQQHFFFKCPHCSRYIELTYPESIVVTGDSLHDPLLKKSYLRCTACNHELDHKRKSEFLANNAWVAQYEERDKAGWYINQMYSPTISPYELATSILMADVSPSHEQELYNSKMGLPKQVKGSSVTDEEIRNAIKDYRQYTSHTGNRVVTVGIDVGKVFHYVIDEWILPPAGQFVIDINAEAKCRTLKIGVTPHLQELEDDLAAFRFDFAVIDSQPERRLAIKFANDHWGKVRACSYEMGIDGKTIHTDQVEPRVKVDRTSWLDLSLGRFKAGTIMLPIDTPEEFKEHLKTQVRVYLPDQHGNPTGRWVTPDGKHDHWAHARNYSEIALPLAASMGTVMDLESPI